MEVKAPSAMLDKLAHAASWDDRLRYVDPLVEASISAGAERSRAPPARHGDRPSRTSGTSVRRTPTSRYNLTKGNPQILVGVVDTGISEIPYLVGKDCGDVVLQRPDVELRRHGRPRDGGVRDHRGDRRRRDRHRRLRRRGANHSTALSRAERIQRRGRDPSAGRPRRSHPQPELRRRRDLPGPSSTR